MMLQQDWNTRVKAGDIMIPNFILHSSELTDLQKLLYGDLHHTLALNGGTTTINLNYFADRHNRSTETIGRNINKMIKKNRIVVIKKESPANKRVVGPDLEFVEVLKKEGIEFTIRN